MGEMAAAAAAYSGMTPTEEPPMNRIDAWPQEQLQTFVMRMADHGFSVSRTFMNADSGYAMDQLSQAHAMADETLQDLALQLFDRLRRD
jgi:hypothetical protein